LAFHAQGGIDLLWDSLWVGVSVADHPHLTLVDVNSTAEHDQEFAPLPFYPWDERPPTVPLDFEEAATAVHLAHGSLPAAARLLKCPEVRLKRLLRQSPRLQRVLDESYQLALDRAVAVPIDTLFDPNADQRAKEWASTKLLQSRLAMGHPLSPAPASAAQTSAASIQVTPKSITFRWRTDADDVPPDDVA
jgi:hypothetical protein